MTTQGTDMLKYLTQKFRSQTLNEIQPFQNKGDEDHDSGTESDEDIHDELEDVDDSVSDCSHHFCCTCNQSSMSRTTTHEISEYSLDSISCTSDYERQSLDFERHSSEEELSTIHKEIASEKRKWSHAHSLSCDSTGSVDEEVKELMLEPQPIMFSSSPPKDISVDYTTCISFDHENEQNCEGTIHLIVGPGSQTSSFRSENSCDVVLSKDKKKHQAITPNSKLSFPKGAVPALISPRKRHRKISVSENGSEYQSSAVRRPSLDFEKMQKNAVKKQCVHSVGKAKVVKIKTVSGGNTVTSKCLSDPSIFSFRSISSVRYGPLTPVEQPPCAH
ncbi:uncharacterized protein LOC133181895 [Saccostrea echinata]|uniref:uncharacterized protein LOC133181895 n=1 Tax=Saccostrea echinata TaxID=191078 RepID=UPI002A8177B0|nr:uncharacterized protein LOC133181895 [Saccostrea echinata]